MNDMMEVNLPGGFLLATIGKITERSHNLSNDIVDEREMIKIEYIQEKMKLMGQKGVITYKFDENPTRLETSDFFDDLILFEEIGWIKNDFTNPHCKLTKKGLNLFKKLEVPDSVKAKFDSVFE